MKSNQQALNGRGFVKPAEIESYNNFTKDQLRSLLHNQKASVRTAAIHVLAWRGCIQEPWFVDLLLSLLSSETALYTRIEICEALKSGDETVATKLLPQLGLIGHNQHKVPGNTSLKKSYPLARDLIARTLCGMQVSEDFLYSMLFLQDQQLKEAIDVVGYQMFYHDMDRTRCLMRVQQLLTKNDPLIIWKCLLCLSAFPERESIAILETYARSSTDIFRREALRSLQLLKERGIQ